MRERERRQIDRQTNRQTYIFFPLKAKENNSYIKERGSKKDSKKALFPSKNKDNM